MDLSSSRAPTGDIESKTTTGIHMDDKLRDKYSYIADEIDCAIDRILGDRSEMTAEEQMEELLEIDLLLGKYQSVILQEYADLQDFVNSIDAVDNA